MVLLRFLLGLLWAMLRALLFGWIAGLWHVLRTIWADCRRACARERLPGRRGKASPKECVTVSDPAMNRPDPLIYDQQYLMSLGFAVTWDNPDIWLEQGGVIVPPDKLMPDTTYDVVARIWNGSSEGSCVGLPVHFSFLSFGVGVQSHDVKPGPPDVTVNLGVKGGPNCPAFATTKWKTPAVAGHYCLQVSFTWIDDANPYNNLGQDNTLVGVSHSPVAFEFQLHNASRLAQAFRFEADAYAIPPLPDCSEGVTPVRTGRGAVIQRPFDPIRVPPQHDRANYPLPAGWSISFQPATPRLAPGDEVTVVATVNPPSGFRGRQPINVRVLSQSGPVGGVSFYVEGS